MTATYSGPSGTGGVALLDRDLLHLYVESSTEGPFLVGTQGEDIYWTSSVNGQIRKIADSLVYVTGGAAPSSSAFASDQPDCQSIAASSAGVFWANAGSAAVLGAVVMHPLPATMEVVIKGQDRPRAVAADGDHVYWRNADGTIYRAGFTETKGTPFATSTAGDLADPHFRAIALSGTEVFWMTVDGLIQKRAK